MTEGTLLSKIGAAGFVKIIAPLPSSETLELPLTFVATIVAQIDCPH